MHLKHLALLVRDIKTARRFYEKYLGFADSDAVWHGDVLFIRDGDGFDLALMKGDHPPNPGAFHHFGFLVSDPRRFATCEPGSKQMACPSSRSSRMPTRSASSAPIRTATPSRCTPNKSFFYAREAGRRTVLGTKQRGSVMQHAPSSAWSAASTCSVTCSIPNRSRSMLRRSCRTSSAGRPFDRT